MTKYPAVAPAQVMVVIDDIIIDDVTAIGWQISADKDPVYGYNDAYPRTWARKQSLVVGTLQINFRYPNALHHVLLNRNRPPDTQSQASDGTRTLGLPTAVQSLIRTEDTYAVVAMIAEVAKYDINYARDLANQTADNPSGDGDGPSSTNESQDSIKAGDNVYSYIYGSGDSSRKRVDIVVVYGDELTLDDNYPRAEIIRDVQFVGAAKQIVSAVPADGQPIEEQYHFKAARVIPYAARGGRFHPRPESTLL